MFKQLHIEHNEFTYNAGKSVYNYLHFFDFKPNSEKIAYMVCKYDGIDENSCMCYLYNSDNSLLYCGMADDFDKDSNYGGVFVKIDLERY